MKYIVCVETSFGEIRVNIKTKNPASEKELKELILYKLDSCGYIDIEQFSKEPYIINIINGKCTD